MTDKLDHEETPNAGRRRYNKLAAASAVAAVAGAGVLLFAFNTTSSNADPLNNNKYFVCKYVGTPGVNETLQTGQNPIDVSGNAIGETPVVVGSFFNDQQGRSYVLAQDTGQPTPPASDCPPPTPPTTSSSVVVSSSSSTVTSSSAGTLPSETSQAPEVTVTETAGELPTSVVAPLPNGVAAGQHTTTSGQTAAIGGALMALGLGGLLTAMRPWKRGSH